MECKNVGRAVAFGFSAHNLVLMGHELSLLWPDKSFLPCLNTASLSQIFNEQPHEPECSILVNLSREFHELDCALHMAAERSFPVIGAIALDFVNAYGLKLCMDREIPIIIGELKGLEELGEAREAIRHGKRFVSRSILKEEDFRFVDYPMGFSLLSEREALCLDARLGGLSSKETSTVLGLDPSTVSTYISRAYGKFGVGSGEELAWLFAGRPMGCYRRKGGQSSGETARTGQARRLFPGRGGTKQSRGTMPQACSPEHQGEGQKKPEQADA
ncbi:MAG: helix-turn-helix transcriptional regulator [Treponema sp.]|nr:helix-turn-helix transcriptional regulator [Treponema sp.]